MIQILQALYDRDLTGAREVVAAYPDDESPWRLLPGWRNSTGTLALHLAGNLQHFVGAALGGTGYERDREAEFAARALSREELIRELDAAAAAVRTGLEVVGREGELLTRAYPLEMRGRTMAVGTVLLHLHSHLVYHLGQMDYHRRAVTGETEGPRLVSYEKLPAL